MSEDGETGSIAHGLLAARVRNDVGLGLGLAAGKRLFPPFIVGGQASTTTPAAGALPPPLLRFGGVSGAQLLKIAFQIILTRIVGKLF